MTELLFSLGSIGFFQSRAFLSAFVTSFLLRYGRSIPFMGNNSLVTGAGATWLASDVAFWVLGTLSVLEYLSENNPDIRLILDSFDKYVKAIVSALVSASVFDVLYNDAGNTVLAAGIGINMVPGLTAVGTFMAAGIRQNVFSSLREADPDDGLSIQAWLARFESVWVILGILLLVIMPLIICCVIVIILYYLRRQQKRLEKQEELSKIACSNCAELIYASALMCPACKSDNHNPMAVGIMGQTLDHPSHDRSLHEKRLREKKRCPHCATRLKSRSATQKCPACGRELFMDQNELSQYLNYVSARVPKVLIICGLLGLVPYIGLIPGMIYYRFMLVQPFTVYLDIKSRFCAKSLLRLAAVVMFATQWIPIWGACILPIVAYMNYKVYSDMFSTAGCMKSC